MRNEFLDYIPDPSLFDVLKGIKGEGKWDALDKGGKVSSSSSSSSSSSTSTVEPETTTANDSEISADEATNTTTKDIESESSSAEPKDYSWITQPAEDDKEKYSDGFDPNDYLFAQNLMEETSDFNYEKNKVKRDLDKAQKDYESSDESYQRELERYNKEAEQAKSLERMGVKVKDFGVKNPGTLEEYKNVQKEKLDKMKEVYDKFQNDSNTFTSYLEKYSGDWEKYQKANPSEDDERIRTTEENFQKLQKDADDKYSKYDKLDSETKAFWSKTQYGMAAAGYFKEMNGKVPVGETVNPKTLTELTLTNDGNGQVTIVLEDADISKTAHVTGQAEDFGFILEDDGSISMPTEETVEAAWEKQKQKYQEKVENTEAAKKDYEAAQANLEKADDPSLVRSEIKRKAQAAKKEAYEKYQKGEISAVDFANKINEAKKYDDLSFDIKPEERELEEITTPGSMEYSKVIQTIRESVQPKIEKINVQEITNGEQVKAATESVKEIHAELVGKSNEAYTSIVKDMLAQGKTLKEIRETKEIKQFSQEIFELAQGIYDKASELEQKGSELGLDYYANPYSGSGILNKIKGKAHEIKVTANAAFQSILKNQPMNKDAAYAVMTNMDSIEGVKDASKALMKSAAFNGATDVKGGAASEAMKEEAVTKLTWRDWVSTSIYGGLGILSIGAGIVTGNPALIGAGIYVNLKKGGEFAGKTTMTNVTNRQQMFGMGEDSKIMNPAIQVYNQSQERANVGDPRSASTYVTATQGALEIASGLLLFPMAGTSAVGIEQMKSGMDTLDTVSKGGLSGNTKTMVENIYQLAQKVSAWSGEELGEEELLEFISSNTAEKSDAAYPQKSSYGTSESGSAFAEGKYSGYREQAKDSNLATDYNEGLEQEVNEAVSDMKVKIFSVYNNEPDYIRNAIGKILKSFKENY